MGIAGASHGARVKPFSCPLAAFSRPMVHGVTQGDLRRSRRPRSADVLAVARSRSPTRRFRREAKEMQANSRSSHNRGGRQRLMTFLLVPVTALVLAACADNSGICLLYTSPSPRDGLLTRMPSSA